MKSKRGQIDKIITTLPVLIFIILIMAAFIFISFSLRTIKDPQKPALASFKGANDFLLKPVEVVINGTTQHVLVIEGVVRSGNRLEQRPDDKQFNDAFVRALIALSSPSDDIHSCLLISSPTNYFFVRDGTYDPDSKAQMLSHYNDEGALTHLSLPLSGKEFLVEYYYGRCL